MNSLILILFIIICGSTAVMAQEEVTFCAPLPGQSRSVAIPPKLGKLLLAEDHKNTDVELPCCGRWWENDPNDLYSAVAFDLGGDGIDEYLIHTKPDGPRDFGHNNPVWVVRREGDRFDVLYRGDAQFAGGPFAVSGVTNGFHDICIVQNNSCCEKEVLILGYNGKNLYELKDCKILSYDSGDIDPKIKFCS